MNRLVITTIVLAGLALASCTKTTKSNSAAAADENSVEISDSSLMAMDVRLEPIQNKVIQSFVYLNGKVVSLPNFRASVTSDIEGKVNNIFVKEGGYVKAGAPLMSMKSIPLIELQGEYMEEKSQSDFLTIEFHRQEELIKSNVGALADFQIAESKYKGAKSKVNALAAKLRLLGIDPASLEDVASNEMSSHLTIYSPIEGYVFRLNVEVGTVATTDILLAELINTKELMADVYVYDNDLDDIHEGQEVEIDFINHLYPSVIGKVNQISRAFDPETKAVTAHVAFVSPEGKLILPDMSVRCVLPRRESNVPGPTVPKGAILVEEDHDFVYITYPDQKKGTMNLLIKERISTVSQNEKEVQLRIHNEVKPGYHVVVSNVMIVENQRKKLGH